MRHRRILSQIFGDTFRVLFLGIFFPYKICHNLAPVGHYLLPLFANFLGHFLGNKMCHRRAISQLFVTQNVQPTGHFTTFFWDTKCAIEGLFHNFFGTQNVPPTGPGRPLSVAALSQPRSVLKLHLLLPLFFTKIIQHLRKI